MRDGNLADAQDRARVFAALNMPKIDMSPVLALPQREMPRLRAPVVSF